MYKIIRGNEIIAKVNNLSQARILIENTNLYIRYSKKARKIYENRKKGVTTK